MITKEIILNYIQANMNANYCFIVYDLLAEPEKCHYWGERVEQKKVEFIFMYENNIFISGEAAFKYIEQAQQTISKKIENVKVTFQPELVTHIKKYFHEFSISDQAGTGKFNQFFTLHCTKKSATLTSAQDFENEEDIGIEVVTQGDNLSKNTPTYIRKFLLDDNLVFGKKHKEEFVSYAPIPHLYTSVKENGLGIFRGVWTDPNHRNKGYSTKTIHFACKKLFEEYNIDDLYLWVESHNKPALTVYKRTGFFIEGDLWGTSCKFSSPAGSLPVK